MWLMYAIAMGTSVADGGIGIGTFATDWTNDVLFGEIVPNALGAYWNPSALLAGCTA